MPNQPPPPVIQTGPLKPQKFSLRMRLRSFRFAWNGVLLFFYREHNARVHAVAALLAVVAGWRLRISAAEWTAVLVAIALVWITELINTAIEKIMDHLSPAPHPQVKEIKDLAAGAVLIAALVACLIGCIIFIPKILP
ncbi:MAG: diacylglycerol kinase family protein [Williamsia sp.]|nr:diacylglycerol kinase family protein [Williamsia sp.]